MMKIVGLSGSIVGSKTRTAMHYLAEEIQTNYQEADWKLIDLAEHTLPFSDGRNYLDYGGDATEVAKELMEADAILIGTPTFQASIPATLKNVFDLLPIHAFENKVIGLVVTAGSSKHYLMAEQQLKPILTYMKAQVVPSYVFIEEKDYKQKEIVNDDVILRLKRLAEDTFIFTKAQEKIQEIRDEAYDF